MAVGTVAVVLSGSADVASTSVKSSADDLPGEIDAVKVEMAALRSAWGAFVRQATIISVVSIVAASWLTAALVLMITRL